MTSLKESSPYLRLVGLVMKHGGTMKTVDTPKGWELEIDAPDGMVWRSSGVHCLVQVCDYFAGDSRSEVLADAIERVTDGVDRCTDKDCEVCE